MKNLIQITSKIALSITSMLLLGNTYGQVISNNGSVVVLSSGTVVSAVDLNNTQGTFTNNGTFNLTGNLTNGGTISGNGSTSVAGNWSNSGTFTPGAGTINFNGTTQSIGGSNPTSFYNATISGGGNKTLSQPITIGNLLTLTSGFIVSDATNKVIFSNSANVTGASNTSFVLGPIQKIGSTGLTDATFTFPSGKNSGSAIYEPVQIKFLAASTTMAFTVDHYTNVGMSGNLDVAVAANKDAKTAASKLATSACECSSS